MLFVLNDEKSAKQFNTWVKGLKNFLYIPDPLYVNTPTNSGQYMETSADQTLLICGSIDFRKNVKNILKSIDFLKPEIKNVIKIRIVGKVKDYYMEEFNHEVAEFRHKHRDVKVDIENRLVSDEYLHDSIASATIVMIPYIAFYASSGILGKAANYGIPVISSSKGVLGELVKQYHLGEVTDEKSPEAIAEAIYKCFRSQEMTHTGFEKYLKDKSPLYFADRLLR
jgi:glycosyltransferase involved in cell wall biosynthesis